MEASPEEERIAKLWWKTLPEGIKGNRSIWTILALYAEYTLRTRTVSFAADKGDYNKVQP